MSVFPPAFEPTLDEKGKPMSKNDGTPMGRHNVDIFGYTGFCCERTFNTDSVPMLTELIATGIIDKATRCIDNATMVEYARLRKAVKVESELVRLGY